MVTIIGSAMKFGLVVHGPEAIDSGLVLDIMDRLLQGGEVAATMGGAMGWAAVLDAGLEDRIELRPRQLVSEALVSMDRISDVVVLLNSSKSRESGMAMGRLALRRVIGPLTRPLVQVDRDFFIRWREGEIGTLAPLLAELGLEAVEAPSLSFCSDRRELSGVRKGESIWINGTVIGKATSDSPIIQMRDGHLAFEGVEIKAQGLERLKVVDLGDAIIRSGQIRRTRPTHRKVSPHHGSKLILVDHCAEDSLFRAQDAWAAVSVGDDTTRITTALLSRLGIPVIGIVDGDEDRICCDASMATGSAVIKLRPGNDDQVGELVRRKVFNGGRTTYYDSGLDALIDRIAAIAGDALIEIDPAPHRR